MKTFRVSTAYHILWLIGAAATVVLLVGAVPDIYKNVDADSKPTIIVVTFLIVASILLLLVHQLMMYMYLEDFQKIDSDFEKWLSKFLGTGPEVALRFVCFILLLGVGAKLGSIIDFNHSVVCLVSRLENCVPENTPNTLHISLFSSLCLFIFLVIYDVLAIKSEKVCIGSDFTITLDDQDKFRKQLYVMLLCDSLAGIAFLSLIFITGNKQTGIFGAILFSCAAIYLFVMGVLRFKQIVNSVKKRFSDIILSSLVLVTISIVLEYFGKWFYQATNVN